MTQLILRNPFLTYSIIGLILVFFVHFTDALYDSGGVKGGLFWLSQLFLIPFWLCRELLMSFSGGVGAFWQFIVATGFQLGICAFADILVRRFF
jgi:hypothetical protein